MVGRVAFIDILLFLAALADSSSSYVQLPDNYDRNKAPSATLGPLVVNVSANLKSILSINEPLQAISLETTLRLGWKDRRLNVSIPADSRTGYLSLTRELFQNLWFPDVYVDKAKDLRTPAYGLQPAYLRIYEDTTVLYSARVNYDLYCPMDFQDYPVDTQICEVIFESWGTPIEVLKFRWREEDCLVDENIRLNQHDFEVTFNNKGESENGKYNTGNYSGLTLRLRLKRKLSYHLLRTYLPSMLFVIIAWFSMFIPLEHVPGRVAMCMTTLLTLSSMFGALTTITPPISYTTKLDVWMVGCIIFVFATLFEFTVVIFLKYYLVDIPNMMMLMSVDDVSDKIQAWVYGSEEKERKARQERRQKSAQALRKSLQEASGLASVDTSDKAGKLIMAIEKFSVIVFLLSFLAFNVYYWLDIIEKANEE